MRREIRGIRYARYADAEQHVTGGGAKTAWFKDSEGNILAISQRI